MKDYEDKSINEIEELLKTKFYDVELESAQETLAAIRPKLKKKRKPNSSRRFATRFAAGVATILVFIGIGLAVWFNWPDGDGPDIPPEYRYEDSNIDLNPCEKTDVLSFPGLYVPDLSLLIMDEAYSRAIHKESLETVYFIAEGMTVDVENGIARKVILTIVIQKKYEVYREDQYNTENKISIAEQEVSVLENDPIEPFYNYKLGFKKGDVRYYMDFQTSSPEKSDVESFLLLFLI